MAPPPPEAPSIAETLTIVDDDADVEETTIATSEETNQAVEIKYVPVAVEEEEPEEQQIFQIVEEMPEFPGGMGERPMMNKEQDSADAQKKAAETKEKKIKKILTTEQYEKWQAQQASARQKHSPK